MTSKNRAILITGCSTGIGAACAKGLHARGYRVFATGRRLETLEPLAKLGIETLELDVSNDDSIQRALREILTRTGGSLYALFNNAGYGQFGAVEDLNRAHIQAQFETNVFGPMILGNAVLPIFRQQGFGRIIQTSSVLGFVTRPFCGAYNASKFALEGLTDTLRLELRGSDIHVSLIEPGPIRSQFRQTGFDMVQTVSIEQSIHKHLYEAALMPEAKAKTEEVPFTLGPEAILKPLIHALESKSPRARYPVTVYTYVFSWLKRLLPTAILDKILSAG
jgi:NAD(P)-dependent dehydrogenase (short-subunit alcohol dehydrogenase family)